MVLNIAYAHHSWDRHMAVAGTHWTGIPGCQCTNLFSKPPWQIYPGGEAGSRVYGASECAILKCCEPLLAQLREQIRLAGSAKVSMLSTPCVFGSRAD